MMNLIVLWIAFLSSAHGGTTIMKDPPVIPKPTLFEDGYLYGQYTANNLEHDNYPTSTASLWDLDAYSHFQIVVWPPKYCQSVLACFVKRGNLLYENIKMEENYCSDGLAIYPYAGKIDRIENGQVKSTHAFSEHHIEFKISADEKSFEYMAHPKKPKSFEEWKATEKRQPIKVNLKEKHVLLLTNSVQCRAHVDQPIRVSRHYPVPSLENVDLKKSKYGALIAKDYYYDDLTSIAVPTYKLGTGRTVDHLIMLKSLKLVEMAQKLRQCGETQLSGHWKDKRFGGRRLTEDVSKMSMKFTRSESPVAKGVVPVYQISIHVTKCHWMRLSLITSKADYEKNPEKFSFDFFFDEGFFQTPDSDEAKPLSGGAKAVGKIDFRFYLKKNDVEFGEFLYSKVGHSFAYRESFKFELLKQNVFEVLLTRSPMCDAAYLPKKNTPGRTLFYNRLVQENCEFDVYK